jgi:hypothetical protein
LAIRFSFGFATVVGRSPLGRTRHNVLDIRD